MANYTGINAKYTGYRFIASFTCPSCNKEYTVDTIEEKVIECPGCKNKNRITLQEWKEKIFVDKEMLTARLSAEGKQVSASKNTLNIGRMYPACTNCGLSLNEQERWTIEELQTAASTHTSINCKRCGKIHSIRKPDDFVSSLVSQRVIAVFNENLQEFKKGTVDSISVDCKKCGAPFKTDGTIRTVKCEYCNTSNYIEDKIWREFHPVVGNDEHYITLFIEEDEDIFVERVYEQLIQKANTYFELKQYQKSKENYLKALDEKPNEQYPQKQIEIINDRQINGEPDPLKDKIDHIKLKTEMRKKANKSKVKLYIAIGILLFILAFILKIISEGHIKI